MDSLAGFGIKLTKQDCNTYNYVFSNEVELTVSVK